MVHRTDDAGRPPRCGVELTHEPRVSLTMAGRNMCRHRASGSAVATNGLIFDAAEKTK